MNKTQSEIQKTNTYSEFKLIKGNRSLNDAHLKNLIRSISRNNMLPSNPIIVNEKMEVIDGQHRLDAGRNLGLPVYYVIRQGAKLGDVQILNTATRKWQVSDYLESYCELGNKSYEILADFIARYEFPISASVLMFQQGRYERMMSKFREGDFKAENAEGAEELAQRIIVVRDAELIEGTVWRTRAFILACKKLFSIMPVDQVIHKLKVSGTILKHRRSSEDYLRDFEAAVNFKVQEENRVRLF